MTFTDDDLRRLEELPDNVVITFKDGPSVKLKALLARLKAAEKAYAIARQVIDGKASYQTLLNVDSKWRKAAGR